jgi:small GTP-binding protein
LLHPITVGIQEKIRELEDELHRTQKNKATEYHIGILKAKIAKLKRELISPKKGGGAAGGGFDVRKSGDSTVVFIGLPSTGKSTLLNALTGAESKVAAYEFTTLTCIPGILNHKGAKIQLLDLPGIIAGAKEGKGRGREILAVARNADLILLVLDVFQPHQLATLKGELEGIGVRLDQSPPDVTIKTLQRGGISIKSTVKLTKLNERMITGLLNEYSIHNGEIVLRDDVSADQLIDVLAGNRRYIPSLTVLNKVDLVSEAYLKQLGFAFYPISAERKRNIDGLKDEIYRRLRMIRIYTKPRMGEADLKEPMMMRSGSTVADACDKLHRELRKEFKYAQIWGPSAKFPGQKAGLEHTLADGDVIFIAKKQGS